jgi:hypothetical protein
MQAAFGEGSTIAACGSDHGKVYVFRLGSTDRLQTLKHCRSKLDDIDRISCTLTPPTDGAMVQAVQVSTIDTKKTIMLSTLQVRYLRRSSPHRKRSIWWQI